MWTYYGYPVCEYEGKNVDQMRYDSGLAMGHKDDTEVDFVSAVPDSGIGMATEIVTYIIAQIGEGTCLACNRMRTVFFTYYKMLISGPNLKVT